LCLYFTKLEPISKTDEPPRPPPLRSGGNLAEISLTIFFLRAPSEKNSKTEREISARFRPQLFGRCRTTNSDEAKQKLFLREEKDFAFPRLFLFGDGTSAAQEGAGGMRGGKSGRD